MAGKANKSNKRFISVGVIAFILVSVFLLFSTNGIFRYYRLKQSLETLRTANEKLKKENEILIEEIARIQNDPEYLEEVARKKFGLIKKNEMIFNFRKKRQ
jgi:cell division protein FtsB